MKNIFNHADYGVKGYRVSPADNGGFIAYLNDKEDFTRGASGGFVTFSNAGDLLAFLLKAHNVEGAA